MARCSSAAWRPFTLAITFIIWARNSFRVSTHNSQLTLHTDSHASCRGAVRREWWTILGAKFKLLYGEIALSRKPFGIGHMYMYTFSLRMTDTMTSQSGFGGLGVACWPLVSKFAGSNPAEAVGFLRAKKSSAEFTGHDSRPSSSTFRC
jgi:hypothetical protein